MTILYTQIITQIMVRPTMNPHELKSRIEKKYQLYDLKKEYTYDELLFILDQECDFQKCDRDVARELFDQSVSATGKACLQDIIFRFVENLQTSQLCLTRQEKASQTLKQKLGQIKGSKKTYAHIKIIQITTHARHSTMPSLSYKIEPSDIPPVTVINSLSPILNHEYTLQLQSNQFTIIFYESGVKICEWTWPDSPASADDGEYYRNIMAENLSFQIKINYKPKDSHPDRKVFYHALLEKQGKIDVEKEALEKLTSFQPFLQKLPNQKEFQPIGCVAKMFDCLPLLKRHVRNLYYSLILLILLQCLASTSWPMQFLDITIAFAMIGTLYDQSQIELGMPLLVFMLSFILLIAKSVWGLTLKNQENHSPPLLVLCIFMKGVCIFLTWIVLACRENITSERQISFYDDVEPLHTHKHKIEL